jgi:hypothetical protein
MLELLSTAGVYLAGAYLLGLGVVAFVAPALATRFLLGHAGTAAVHYLELLIRAAVGAAFLIHAPSMRFSAVFLGVGWVLLATTAALVAVPWRWHQRFAQRSVPLAVRFLPLIAAASLLMGSLVLLAAADGAT